MPILRGLIESFWSIFFVYWLISARGAKKNVPNHRWGQWIAIRIAIVALVVALPYLPGFSQLTHLLIRYDPGIVSGGLGVLLCALGLAFAVWARVQLGRNWGMPMTVKEDLELVTTGPYAMVRHPIYGGMLVAIVGSALVFNYALLILAAILCGCAVYAARTEELRMSTSFPEAYARYQHNTKLLIPYVF